MRVKSFLSLLILATSLSQKVIAENTLQACMTMGTTNNGVVKGLRLYKNDSGSFFVDIDEVTMWHHTIINFKPLKNINLEKVFSDSGETYRGDEFELHVINQTVSGHTLAETMGSVQFVLAGIQVKGDVNDAPDSTNEYCK